MNRCFSNSDIEILASVSPLNSLQIIFQNQSNQSYEILVFDHVHFLGISDIKQSLGYLLGFRKGNYIVKSNETLLPEAFVNMYPICYLYLIMDEFGGHMQSSFLSMLPNSTMNKNILARVSLDTNKYGFGSFMVSCTTKSLVSDKREYNGKINMQRLKLQIVNEWGQNVNFNGENYSFVMEVEYE